MEIGGSHGVLVWSADYNTEPTAQYGSGAINLGAEKTTAIPPSMPIPPVTPCEGPLSPNDSMFRTSVKGEYRWNVAHRNWSFLGPLPINKTGHSSGGTNGCDEAVSNEGTVWTAHTNTASTRWRLQRAVPRSRQIQSWLVPGPIIGVGPGYAIYVPHKGIADVAIYFPLQHRVLTFTHLSAAPEGSTTNGLAVTEDGLDKNGFATVEQSPYDPSRQLIITEVNGKRAEIEISATSAARTN